MKRRRFWIVAGAALTAIGIGGAWYLLRDTPDKVGRRLANAWATGDVQTILRYIPAGERAALSEQQLRTAYQKAILDEFGNFSLKSLEKDEPVRLEGKVRHQFVATYEKPDGADFEVEITVTENRNSFTSAAIGTLLRIYDGEAISRGLTSGEYDGSYDSYIKIQSVARKRVNGLLVEAGVSHVYIPSDGRLFPLE